MVFPFGDHPPKKDITKVHFTLVRTSNQSEKDLLFDFILKRGYTLMSEDMKTDHVFTVIGIPKNQSDKVIGYVSGIHVLAEQTYHGAVIYKSPQHFFLAVKNDD